MANEIKQKGSSSEERAKRVIAIRKALRLSRPKFSARFDNIPLGTLQNWEESRFGGLSEKGAKRLVQALQAQGIDCSIEWLLYGLGSAPSIIYLSDSIFSNKAQVFQEDEVIAQELKVFYQLNPNAVDTIVNDGSMMPCFEPGDHVAGRRYFEKNMAEFIINRSCIIHLHGSSNVLVRIVEPGSHEGFYTLTCTNPSSEHQPLKDIKLLSAAPILWIRRKGILYKI